MQLALGLGNPGEKYARTRHNLGFRVVDLLGDRLGTSFEIHEDRYLIGLGLLEDAQIALVKPLTYMNESGRAAINLIEGYQVDLDRLLVICDDTNLPLGKIRLRRSGSDGGHRGLESIIYHLASENFPRLRMGIGPLPENQDMVTFVLANFEPEEEILVTRMVQLAAEAASCFLQDGIEDAMNRYNA
ncbi:aminoacyl-tRNA hydrolase [bacterium]|nr:aminoacyl-tRNA hydrolase [bacterium]